MTTSKALLFALTLALGSTAARAETQHPRISANACAPTSSSATSYGRGTLGFYNASTTSNLALTCTLPIAGIGPDAATTTANRIRVYYNDNHGSSGKAVSCTAYLTDVWGHGFALGTRYSCSTPGGCTSSTATFTGQGYLELSSASAVDDAAQVYVTCSVPPVPSGWAVSSLYSVVGDLTVVTPSPTAVKQ